MFQSWSYLSPQTSGKYSWDFFTNQFHPHRSCLGPLHRTRKSGRLRFNVIDVTIWHEALCFKFPDVYGKGMKNITAFVLPECYNLGLFQARVNRLLGKRLSTSHIKKNVNDIGHVFLFEYCVYTAIKYILSKWFEFSNYFQSSELNGHYTDFTIFLVQICVLTWQYFIYIDTCITVK